ncbi:MAG: tetratricopeptide repeat protein [Planctomycetaceae bacterium]|nr:tetratricopeptide repeat protein [Planctomycetaceae bacterium]
MACDIVCAQNDRSYGGYPYSPYSVYVANREMMPQSALAPPPTNPLKPTTPAAMPLTPPAQGKNAKPENNELNDLNDLKNPKKETTKESSINKIKSYFTSVFYPSKNTKPPKESKEQESLENIDDGQEMIEALKKEQNYSEPDYVNSATRSTGTTAKDYYKQGLQFEVQGDFPEAVRSYNAFIAANKKQTATGTLAAPYHRLALIAWKQTEIRNASVYFRYAMKYALDGNVPIIAGDFALFLMEQNDLKQAEVILRNALIHYPENNRLLYYLGRCTARQDKPIEAMRYFSTALGEERAYQELALLYRQRGDFERANFLDAKRDEYLVRRGKIVPQQVFASQPPNRPPGVMPTTPPPVIPNPRGMMSQATMGTPMPLPTLDHSEKQHEQAFTTNTHPNNPGLPHGYRSTIPEDSWQPMKIPPTPPPLSVSPMPVSKVFHYPSDQVSPVYHEFQGDQYPQDWQPANPVNPNVVQTSFAP